MKIFLDIGSHVGQTLREVTKEKYAFDKIVAFEPSSFCLDELKKIAAEDDRVEICEFGLSNKNEDIQLFLPGTQAGSIYDEGHSVEKEEVETIKLCDACEWFENNTSAEDYVVVKTNCEGSEVDILDSLLDGLILRTTQNIGAIEVEHHPRAHGKSGYTFKKLISLWLNMFTNFSILPLRIAIITGFIFAIIGLVLGIQTVYEKFVNPDLPTGYAAIITIFSIFSGIQLMAIGMVGEYLGRTFLSLNKKPQFTIRSELTNKKV